jgi:histidine kinase
MSIRTKLLVSQMVMTLISILLLVVMNFYIPESFMRGLQNNFNVSDNANKPPVKPLNKQAPSDNAGINIKDITSRNFRDSQDIKYIKGIDKNLNKTEKGIIVRKGNRIVYVSSLFKKTNVTKELPPFGTFFEQPQNQNFDADGKMKPYIIKQKDVYFKDGTTGSVFLVIKTRHIVQPFNRSVQYSLIIMALFIMIINIIIIRYITKGIINPIESLKNAARQIKNSNLNYVVEVKSKDELGELCSDFEDMRIKLKESVEIQRQYELNRTELISNISHDLKTPITSIKGYIEGVLDGVANSPEKVEKYLRTAYSKVNDVDLLIDELFLFSKLDLKKLPFDFENVNIIEYLEDCYVDLQLDAEEKNITIEYNVETKGYPMVKADRDKLKRVITNIVENSIKYMGKEEGRILLNLKEEEDHVIIKIQDNGQGISEDSVPFVFERFYRSDASRNSSTGGSGLGLAIVKRIVEEHGGKIWAESIEGVGTSMLFTLNKVTNNDEEGKV